MKYNTKIVKALNSIKNNQLRKNTKKGSIEYVYYNQIDAAKEIVKSFCAYADGSDEETTRNNHVILLAKMQSGKTATCNTVVNIFETNQLIKEHFGVERYLFVNGMNDNGIHEQTSIRIQEQVFNVNSDNFVNGFKQLKNKSSYKVFVAKNVDMKNVKNEILNCKKNNKEVKDVFKLKNCVVFIDESHYGSNEENVLTKFLEENNINWRNTQELKIKIFI